MKRHLDKANLVDQQGFAIIPNVILPNRAGALIAALGPITGAGRRGLLHVPVVSKLAHSPRIIALLQPHLPSEPKPVRSIYFDKSPDANWGVAWHQDLTLALRKRVDVPGVGPWSVKEGVPHVQPPIPLLERMLTIRLHLDDCDENNGALRVLPGSHRMGRLDAGQIKELRTAQPEALCALSAGDALLMRPLLPHASSRSTSARRRRILHIEYAAFPLPPELEWHETA